MNMYDDRRTKSGEKVPLSKKIHCLFRDACQKMTELESHIMQGLFLFSLLSDTELIVVGTICFIITWKEETKPGIVTFDCTSVPEGIFLYIFPCADIFTGISSYVEGIVSFLLWLEARALCRRRLLRIVKGPQAISKISQLGQCVNFATFGLHVAVVQYSAASIFQWHHTKCVQWFPLETIGTTLKEALFYCCFLNFCESAPPHTLWQRSLPAVPFNHCQSSGFSQLLIM